MNRRSWLTAALCASVCSAAAPAAWAHPGPHPFGLAAIDLSAGELASLFMKGGGETSIAAAAPDANSVLILSETVIGGAASVEATEAAAVGLTPVVMNAAGWAGMTAADFASYRAIVMGDPNCTVNTAPLAGAEATRSVWSPVVQGNAIIIGTDPFYHINRDGNQGARTLIRQGIEFAANADKTGLYVDLSCDYWDVSSGGTLVSVLDRLGTFRVKGQLQFGCPQNSHIVADHPALAGLADSHLSNWTCSVHEGFLEYAPSFNVLAISLDLTSSYVASDGTTGLPYILARGQQLVPIGCGDGVVEGDEQCDDGNPVEDDDCTNRCRLPECGDGITTPGYGEICDDGNVYDDDGCSADCGVLTSEYCGDGVVTPPETCDDGNHFSGDGCGASCEEEVCGDGFLDAGEQCDDGNNDPGDGCSPSCTLETPPNCGDGVVQYGEECDDGNDEIEDGCGPQCLAEICGNGRLDGDEECDDGNFVDLDGCAFDCTWEDLGCDCQDTDGDAYADPIGECEGSDLELCGAVDCDDADPAVHPGAGEVCDDGIDNDCDGDVDAADADCSGSCTDADGDGYAIEGGACGLVDCDDANAAIHPGAAEIPGNGIDEDCDGEDLPAGAPDVDGDGFGDEAASLSSCDDPGGDYIEQGGDCDDAEPSVNPGATEVRADGVDQDCDGFEACFVDADGDGYGVLQLGFDPGLTCDVAGLSTTSDDCDDTNADVSPGAVEVQGNGVDDDC
ncbi:MAG: DUF4215 domain-containing protein, partial [Myxococcales bacterium]|nr:DUF4215 domain-containing protein [Myxococcales bacterium]